MCIRGLTLATSAGRRHMLLLQQCVDLCSCKEAPQTPYQYLLVNSLGAMSVGESIAFFAVDMISLAIACGCDIGTSKLSDGFHPHPHQEELWHGKV